MESAQIKGRDDGGRAELAETVHPFLKFAHGIFGAEEVRKNGAVPAECLFPSRTALADRIFQVPPHRVQGVIRIADVSAERIRTVGPQELFRFRSIDVLFASFFKQAKCNASAQQARKFFAVRRSPTIKDSKLDRGEHGFRAAERVNQIKNEVGGGHSRLAPVFFPDNAVRPEFLLLWYRSEFLARDASDAPYRAARNLHHREALVRRLRRPLAELNLFQPRLPRRGIADANQARARR